MVGADVLEQVFTARSGARARPGANCTLCGRGTFVLFSTHYFAPATMQWDLSPLPRTRSKALWFSPPFTICIGPGAFGSP